MLIVVAVIVICCGGLGAIGYGVYSVVRGTVDPMKAAASAYLNALKAADYPGAYGMLCDRVREQTTPELFTTHQANRPVRDYEITAVYSGDRSGFADGRVTAKVAFTDGTTATQVLPMVEEDDTWRVCAAP